MTKTLALALAGVVLAFAICRAESVERCAAPGTLRAVLLAGKQDRKHSGIRCPVEGLCFYIGLYEAATPATVTLICFTDEQHRESLQRYYEK